MQDLALGLIEPYEVHAGPLFKLLQDPLDAILSLRRVNCTTQLGVICKLAEGALNPAVYVIDENTKQNSSANVSFLRQVAKEVYKYFQSKKIFLAPYSCSVSSASKLSAGTCEAQHNPQIMEHSTVGGGQHEQQSKSQTDKREAVQENSEYAELQGESLLDSNMAVQDFSHAALVRR